MTSLFLSPFAALSLADADAFSQQAYTLKTLASFNGDNGLEPTGALTLGDGVLYGTTQYGGSGHGGTVFSVSTGGGPITVLNNLSISTAGNPVVGLLLSGDTLYGAAPEGVVSTNGDSGYGNVFSLPKAGGPLTILGTFDHTTGIQPDGDLAMVGGTLYGTTAFGGRLNSGTLYSLPVGGGPITTLVTFTTGGTPLGNLTVSGGTFYGTTSQGGSNGFGTVYSVPVGGTSVTTLASFSYATGYNPEAGLALANGTLYGTVPNSFFYGGAVFSVPVSGGPVTTLATFSQAAGKTPSSGLALVGSTLFGTTEFGGDTTLNSGQGDGTLYSLPLAGGPITTLVSFNGANGARPVARLTPGNDGVLYGVTYGGGDDNDGTVFALMPTPEASPAAVLNIGILGLGALVLTAKKRSSRYKA